MNHYCNIGEMKVKGCIHKIPVSQISVPENVKMPCPVCGGSGYSKCIFEEGFICEAIFCGSCRGTGMIQKQVGTDVVSEVLEQSTNECQECPHGFTDCCFMCRIKNTCEYKCRKDNPCS